MTDDKQRKTPVLRFKGFHDDWEQRKLGDIASFENGRAFKQKELLDQGKYPVLRVGNFYTNSKWYYSNLELSENKYANKGDLLYTWSATFGPHIWRGKKVIYHYHIWNIKFKGTLLNKLFLLYFLDFDKSQLLSNTNGSTMIHVTKTNMENKRITFPNVNEQTQIGNILKKLNNLISLQQRKITLFKKLKTSINHNLFNTKKVRILSQSENEKWKRYKLRDLGKCISGYGFPIVEQGGKQGIPFYKVSDFNLPQNKNILCAANNYVTMNQVEKNRWNIFNNLPAVLFAKIGAAIFLNRKRISVSPYLMDNNLMAFEIDTSKLNKYFAKVLFENIYLPKYAQTGALPSYNAKDIESIGVIIPNMKTQNDIGQFIQELDLYINSNSKILIKYKELKKFLLQNMFI